MARLQVIQTFQVSGITTTPKQISNTTLNVTSFIIQNPASSTDFIKVGNLSGQFFQIAAGRDLAIQGDSLDNGTNAYLDLSTWYVSSVSGTQTANVNYLERF